MSWIVRSFGIKSRNRRLHQRVDRWGLRLKVTGTSTVVEWHLWMAEVELDLVLGFLAPVHTQMGTTTKGMGVVRQVLWGRTTDMVVASIVTCLIEICRQMISLTVRRMISTERMRPNPTTMATLAALRQSIAYLHDRLFRRTTRIATAPQTYRLTATMAVVLLHRGLEYQQAALEVLPLWTADVHPTIAIRMCRHTQAQTLIHEGLHR